MYRVLPTRGSSDGSKPSSRELPATEPIPSCWISRQGELTDFKDSPHPITSVRFSVLRSLVPLAVLAALVMVWVNSPPSPPGDADSGEGQASEINLDPSRFLLKPFFVQANQIAVALDGGEIPVPGGQVPSIVVGANVLRTVHLSWVHDWTDAETRASFKALQALYASEEGASLPALRIYLNPVFSDSSGEAVQRAMLQVFFRADNRDLYQILARELATGALATDPEAIRCRVEAIEPLLMDDWNSRLDWLEVDIEKTFSVAQAQQARHAKILDPAFKAQLASMLDIAHPSADMKELSTFVRKADTVQRTWLHTQSGPSLNEN